MLTIEYIIFIIVPILRFPFIAPITHSTEKGEGAILCRVLRSYSILTHQSVWHLPF